MSDGQTKRKLIVKTSHSQSSSPVIHNAITKLKSLDQYTRLRNHRLRFEDAFDLNAERVHTANKLDIIFGRGKSLQDYPGNQRMRQITNKYKHMYHSLQRSQKRNLVEHVYKEIVSNGTRFLVKAPNATDYLLVDVEVALQKVSSSLRCRKQEKRQLLAEKDRQSPSDQRLPIVNTCLAVSVPPLERSSHSIPCKVGDERVPTRESWNPSYISRGAAVLLPSVHAVAQTSNIVEVVATMQHLNQCRRLRMMMDARIKSSIAVVASSRHHHARLSERRIPTAQADEPDTTKQHHPKCS